MILARQVVIVDDSSIGNQVMYGFDLARNHICKGHRREGYIQVGLAEIWCEDVDQIRQDFNYVRLCSISLSFARSI